MKNKLSGDNPYHYSSLTPPWILWRHYSFNFKCFWLFPHFFFGQEEMNFNIWVFWLQYDDDHQALSVYIQEMWPQGLSQCQEQLCLHSHISKYGRPSISHTLLLFWGGTPISKSRAGLTYLKVWEAYHFSYSISTRQFKLFWGGYLKRFLAAFPIPIYLNV